jgi:hypothetical protein
MTSKIIYDKLINGEQLSTKHINFTKQLTEPLSYNNLGYMYYTGTHLHVKNIQKATELFENGTELGVIECLINLGNLYYLCVYNNHYMYKKLYTKIKNDPIYKDELKRIRKPKLSKIYGSFDDDCTICKESLKNTFDGIIILNCGHMFHIKCLNNWSETNKCVYDC